MNNIEIENIEKVYTGIAGKCCCGCSGRYSYPTSGSDEAEERGGRVSDRSVKIIAKKVLSNPNVHHMKGFSFVEIGNRLLTVYYKSSPVLL